MEAVIYIARIPSRAVTEPEIAGLYPVARREQIRETKNERARGEKYFAWRLLEAAALDFLGRELSALNLKKSDTGRWVAEEFDLSISHSDGAAAVIISEGGVGVDIQRLDKPHGEPFAKRTLTEGELNEYYRLLPSEREDFLIGCWCGKEALFKAGAYPRFIPRKADTLSGVSKTVLTLGEQRYCLAAAGAFTDMPTVKEIELR